MLFWKGQPLPLLIESSLLHFYNLDKSCIISIALMVGFWPTLLRVWREPKTFWGCCRFLEQVSTVLESLSTVLESCYLNQWEVLSRPAYSSVKSYLLPLTSSHNLRTGLPLSPQTECRDFLAITMSLTVSLASNQSRVCNFSTCVLKCLLALVEKWFSKLFLKYNIDSQPWTYKNAWKSRYLSWHSQGCFTVTVVRLWTHLCI